MSNSGDVRCASSLSKNISNILLPYPPFFNAPHREEYRNGITCNTSFLLLPEFFQSRNSNYGTLTCTLHARSIILSLFFSRFARDMVTIMREKCIFGVYSRLAELLPTVAGIMLDKGAVQE